MTTWFTLNPYTPPAVTGAGSNGGVGGGWTDPNNQWRTNKTSAGVNVIETLFNTGSPWANAQLLRLAANEAAINTMIQLRWLATVAGSPSYDDAPWVIARAVPNTTNNQLNALIARLGSTWALTSGSLSGTQQNGSVAAAYAANLWWDTQVTFVTSGSTTTITEQTWTVANAASSTFGSGTAISNNSWTTSTYPSQSGGQGVFFYEPSDGQIAFFNTSTDIAATALTASPSSATGTVGSATTFTLAVNGAQNGGAITLSDGGKGGTFSPASPTLGAGIDATVTFTYTPANTGSITIIASSSALTGSALSATATLTATTGPASALTVSPSSQSVVAGVATANYTVSTNGVTSSSTTVALSDGGAGGAFSPTSITLASGTATSGTFSYTPVATAATGTITLTATATGLSAASSSAAVTAQATALTLSPSSQIMLAGSGSGAYTVSVASGALASSKTVTLSDGGAGGTFTPSSLTLATSASPSATFTYRPASNASGTKTLIASAAGLTSATASAVVSAAATALAVTPASQSVVAGAATGAYTVSTNGPLASAVTLSLSDGGNQGTFSPVSPVLAAGSGTTVTLTYTPAPQSLTQNNPITISASGLTSASATASVTVAATALVIAPSSQSVAAGSATGNYTVSLASGALASSATVSLADGGAGGTFTPASLSLAAGLSPTAIFTYTPAVSVTGTKTLTASATGLTSATSSVVVSAATILTPANASVVASPYNWVTGLANTTTSDISAVRTWNTGSYLRAYVSGTTTVNILFGASTTSAFFMYQVDDGLPSAPIACLNNASYAVTLPDTGAHFVTFTLYSISQITGRWAGTLAVTINGFQLGAGGVGAAATRGSRNLLIYGDSITEGTQSHDGSDGITTGYAYLVGEAHRRQGGWEYGIKGAGFSGYAVTVPAANGGQPPAWTSGSDANSSWNKIDGSGIAGAALTTGTIGGSSERFITQPNLIIDVWGTNDGLQSIAAATVQATIIGFFQRLRVAAPNTVIVTVIPFGGYVRSTIQAAALAVADPKLLLVDPQTDARMTPTGYCGNLLTGATSGQNVHPWSLGSANLASLLLRLIDASYVPFATARSYGSAS